MITLENINFGYKPKKKLFSGLKETFNEGTIYGVLGKNGTGKTTLLKLLSGAVLPQNGNVYINGKINGSRKINALQNLLFIPEEISLPGVPSKTYINTLAKFYPGFDLQLFNRCMEEFEIEHTGSIKNLSMGQQKKLYLSFAFATHCNTILFDEPTNGLDIPSKRKFRSLVTSLFSPEKTYIISTHQVRDLQSLIDHVVIIDEGNILFSYPYHEISQKIAFSVGNTPNHNETLLYSEDNILGKVMVTTNNAGIETHIDLELLFNAAVCNKNYFQTLKINSHD